MPSMSLSLIYPSLKNRDQLARATSPLLPSCCAQSQAVQPCSRLSHGRALVLCVGDIVDVPYTL